MMASLHVQSDPYPWPYDGNLRPENTTFIIIDMQTDFCGKGGYVDAMGYDLSLTRAPIGPISRVLAVMRSKGFHIIHARGFCRMVPDRRCRHRCGKILVRGEPG